MQYFLSLAMLGIVVIVAGCSDRQVAKFQHSIDNFTAAVHSVDSAVAQLSSALYKNCQNIQSVGAAAVQVSGTCSKASGVVAGVNTAIDSYCQAAQVTSISSAASASANAYSAYKTGLAAAKASCAAGG